MRRERTNPHFSRCTPDSGAPRLPRLQENHHVIRKHGQYLGNARTRQRGSKGRAKQQAQTAHGAAPLLV